MENKLRKFTNHCKNTPTAKVAEKIASMPKQKEYNSYSWVGKMLDR